MSVASETSRRRLRVELLGPLALKVGGSDVAPSAPRLRAVLSLLALNANRVVTIPVFSRELWGPEPPVSARNTVQTYVFHLRRLVGEALGDTPRLVAQQVLRTHADGYLLRLAPGQSDILDFERLIVTGDLALNSGKFEQAARALHDALALWRGPVSHDWSLGSQAHAQATRLEELRFRALMMHVEANLCAGRHQEMVSELASLMVEHPLQQTVHAMSMIALHRSDRTSGALAVFRKLFDRMREELGIEPSARVQALHRALLVADPVLEERTHRLEAVLDRIAAR